MGKRLFCAEAQPVRLGFHRPIPNSLVEAHPRPSESYALGFLKIKPYS
jgi:hypothetical protein